nr:2,2',3-trihydroxybiphenyl dioxygenase - Sphingomonas sp. (strain RW1) [Sphingomonas sp.]
MSVKQLGYLIFECRADVLEQMVVVYQDIIGAVVERDEGGRALVRLDGRPFRIRLDPGPANRLAAIGWNVDPSDLAAIAEQVEKACYSVVTADAELAADRAAAQVRQFADNDGFTHELYVESSFPTDPVLESLFVCGEEANGIFGLGHLVVIVADRAKTQSFFTDVLGFGLSDRVTCLKPTSSSFTATSVITPLHFRHRRSVLSQVWFNHLMLEAKSKEQVDRRFAAVKRLGYDVLMTIGQHSNDKVYSFYMMAPAGFAVELGFGGQVIGDLESWHVGFYDAPSIWGHELQLPAH